MIDFMPKKTLFAIIVLMGFTTSVALVARSFAAGVGARGERRNGSTATALKSESFDKDPGWEASNNRLVTNSGATIAQDFGYSDTNFASQNKGEIGGLVWRAPQPAWYAAKISPKTLDDTLSASGAFAITHAGGGGHVFFGWFNAKQPEEIFFDDLHYTAIGQMR
jgi:hypothetical protein